jgi:hypothetical protein
MKARRKKERRPKALNKSALYTNPRVRPIFVQSLYGMLSLFEREDGTKI